MGLIIRLLKMDYNLSSSPHLKIPTSYFHMKSNSQSFNSPGKTEPAEKYYSPSKYSSLKANTLLEKPLSLSPNSKRGLNDYVIYLLKKLYVIVNNRIKKN